VVTHVGFSLRNPERPRLGGESFGSINSPQSRRDRRGGAEKSNQGITGLRLPTKDLTENSHSIHAILTSTVHNHTDNPGRSEQLLWPRRNL